MKDNQRLCLICGARVANMNQRTETCSPECTEHLNAGRLTQKSGDAYLRKFSTDYLPEAPKQAITVYSIDGYVRTPGV